MWSIQLALLILAPQCLDASRMNIVKKVKTEPQLEQWEKELCIVLEGGLLRGHQDHKAAKGTANKPMECRKAIGVEDAHCKELEAQKFGALSHADFDSRCKSFKQTKARIEKEVDERVGGGTIKIAVEACEPEVKEVCIANTCPIMCFVQNKTDCDCEQICMETAGAMWRTGSLDCEEDQTFAKCQEELHAKLKGDNRHPELEALMREHTLKCICVAWRPDKSRDICYQGSKGIKPGTRWCDFHDTGSWTKMLTKYADEDVINGLPKPDCTAIPGPNNPTLRSQQCPCSWAAPNSPLSVGIVAGVLWLAAVALQH